jgi:hypothetical protein
VASIKRGIELRGTRDEPTMSAWYLFEVTDTLSAIASRDAASDVLRDGLESVAAFARTIGPDAARAGDLVQVAVRQVAVGAAVEQLARLARAAGVAFEAPAESFPGTDAALELLDREHRPFDMARIHLWMAEAGEPAADLTRATSTFEELGAHPYLERARSLVA